MPNTKQTPTYSKIAAAHRNDSRKEETEQTSLLQYIAECEAVEAREKYVCLRLRVTEKAGMQTNNYIQYGGMIFSTESGEQTFFVQGKLGVVQNVAQNFSDDIQQAERDIVEALRNNGVQSVDSLVLKQHIELEIAKRDIIGICKILGIQPEAWSKASAAEHALRNFFRALDWFSSLQFRYTNLPDDFVSNYEHVVLALIEKHIALFVQEEIAAHKSKKRKPYKHKRAEDQAEEHIASQEGRYSSVSPESLPPLAGSGRQVAIHLEKSQFGRTQPDPMSLMTVIHDAEVLQQAEENNIEIIGIDPSWNGFKAIAALQKAFTRQGYRPEPEFIDVIDDEEIATSQGMSVRQVIRRVPNPMYNNEINSIRRAFKFKEGLPRLIYKSWTEYYEDFGVPKYETERGKVEYNGKIKLEAEEALASLVKNAFVWNYIRVRNPKSSQEVREDVTAYAPLIAAVQVVRNEHTKELEYIEIIPSPVMVDQVSTHFLIYPSDLEDQVFRALNAKGKGRPPRYQLLFVKWLYLRAKENGLRPFSNSYRELGRILRMDAWIDTRQDKRVRDSLEKCFTVALNLNLVLKIDRANDRFTFYLNPEKFRRKTQSLQVSLQGEENVNEHP